MTRPHWFYGEKRGDVSYFDDMGISRAVGGRVDVTPPSVNISPNKHAWYSLLSVDDYLVYRAGLSPNLRRRRNRPVVASLDAIMAFIWPLLSLASKYFIFGMLSGDIIILPIIFNLLFRVTCPHHRIARTPC